MSPEERTKLIKAAVTGTEYDATEAEIYGWVVGGVDPLDGIDSVLEAWRDQQRDANVAAQL